MVSGGLAAGCSSLSAEHNEFEAHFYKFCGDPAKMDSYSLIHQRIWLYASCGSEAIESHLGIGQIDGGDFRLGRLLA
jgi:hypothetical protein